VHLADEGHDYGPSKRQAMYAFIAKHLHLDLTSVTGADGRVDETWATVAPVAALQVFDAVHPDDLRPDLEMLAKTLRSLREP